LLTPRRRPVSRPAESGAEYCNERLHRAKYFGELDQMEKCRNR